MNWNKPNHKPRGSALITALFIMALIAAAAVAMIYQLSLSISRSQQISRYSQALQYNNTVLNWAMVTLNPEQKPTNTLPLLKLPVLYATTKVPGGEYRGVLMDMQGKFNLNRLTDAKLRPGFTNMLKVILGNEDEATRISDAIVDWISYNPKSSLDAAYQKAGLAYHAPHHPMLNLSELRKVLGITQKLYRRLSLFVTVLPTTGNESPININTAPTAVLLSLSPDMTLQTAQSIVNSRPFTNNSDIASNPIIKNHKIDTTLLTTRSSLFDARSLITLGQQTILIHNYLYRKPSDGKVYPLWQTQGNSQ